MPQTSVCHAFGARVKLRYICSGYTSLRVFTWALKPLFVKLSTAVELFPLSRGLPAIEHVGLEDLADNGLAA